MAASSSSSSSALTSHRQSQVGTLYQITRGDNSVDSIIGSAYGIKTKEQELYLYSIPPNLAGFDPFQHQRLKSIWPETEVVIFDFPPPAKEKGPLKEMLQGWDEETLLKMDERLNAPLKMKFAGQSDPDEVFSKMNSEFPVLIDRVAFKLFLLFTLNVDQLPSFKQKAADVVAEQLSLKEQLYAEAQKAGKKIEYIRQENPLSANPLMQFVFLSILPDLPLLQAMASEMILDTGPQENIGEKDSRLKKLEEQFRGKEGAEEFMRHASIFVLDCKFELQKSIDASFQSKKKTLLVHTGMELDSFEKTFEFISSLNVVLGEGKLSYKRLVSEPVGCFWKIKKDTKTVGYVLGSIHVTPSHLHALNSRITKCFGKSARLAVEIDITRPDVIEDGVASIIKDAKEKYKTWTSEEINHIIHALQLLFPEESKEVDFSNEDEKIRFIFTFARKLQSKIYTDLGLFSGIDDQLIKTAKDSGKPVEDLETIEQYAQLETPEDKSDLSDGILKILATGELKDNVQEVMNLLLEQLSLTVKEKLTPMFDAWEAGDVEKFDTAKQDSPQKTMLMTQRNLNMAKKTFELVNSNERIFCCVGAAHTAGMMSVQAFLHNFGFTTERVLL